MTLPPSMQSSFIFVSMILKDPPPPDWASHSRQKFRVSLTPSHLQCKSFTCCHRVEADSHILGSASSPGVKRSMPMTRIPKKWSWTGELKLISPADSRSLGQARISDGTFRPDTGIPWGTALDGQSELTLSLHHIVDMPTILDTCLPLRQFARINDEATDEVRPTSLDKLASTLLLGDLVCIRVASLNTQY